jgi:hypothetical protein
VRDRGLRDIHFLGGTGKTQGIRHSQKAIQLKDVH